MGFEVCLVLGWLLEERLSDRACVQVCVAEHGLFWCRRGRVLTLHTEERRLEVSYMQTLSHFCDLNCKLSAAHLWPGEVISSRLGPFQ